MPAAPNGSYPFQLAFSQVIADALRKLQRQASSEGRGEAFLNAVRTVIDRLRTEPTTFGEPLYHLPNLRMEVRCALVAPFGVDFGVCEDRPLVFIKAVRLLGK
jgi:hypothetical protein